MEDLGYETNNSIMNLGSIFILLCYLVSKLILLGLIKAFLLISNLFISKDKMKTLRKFYKRNMNDLIFGSFIMLFMEAFMEFIISGILNTSNKIDAYSFDDTSAVLVGNTSLLITLIIMPVSFVYVMLHSL